MARTPGAEMELARRQHPVVQLHNAGYSYRRIAELTGMSKSTCQRIYREVLADARGVKDIERHRDEMFADIEMTLDALRPFVLQLPAPPDFVQVLSPKDLHDTWGKTLKAKREFLGLDAPKESLVMHEDVNEAARVDLIEDLADMAVWARKTGAISVDGYNPALPPDMTVSVNGNGHGPVRPGQVGMWSTVLAYPSDDDADYVDP